MTTLTSTYDHRIIQGAQSGEFLRRMHQLLLGADRFYEDIFESLRIPYAPVQWASDRLANRADQVGKQARVIELIDAWRRFDTYRLISIPSSTGRGSTATSCSTATG